MAADAIQRIDAYSVAQATESQNQERERRRESARDRDRGKGPFPKTDAQASAEPAPPPASSQIIDSSTVAQLLSRPVVPAGRARFLSPTSRAPGENRRKTDAKKLDRSA